MGWINFSIKEVRELRDILSSTNISSKIIRKLINSEKRIKISSAKSKGRNLQKWICTRLAFLLNIKYDQQDDNCLIHSREMGQKGVDIVLRGEALKRFPFSIECKSSEKLDFLPTIEQAERNKKKDTDWLIVYKRKAIKEPVVIIYWSVFERIYKWN